MEIRHYTTSSGKNVFESWLRTLKDSRVQARIMSRLDRIVAGNFGDSKPVGSGVNELRIDAGPGYRIYYAMIGQAYVLLLCGGTKHRQPVDIAKAVQYLQDFKTRRASP